MIGTPQPVGFGLRSLFTAVLAATVILALGLLVARQSPLTESPSKPNCAERLQVRLFFGLGTPDGTLSDDEWRRFLADVVTPRFPRGLTVVHADGQWRGSDHVQVMREPSRVVEIVHEDQRDLDRRVQEIVAIYRRWYRQESVMLTKQRIEACF
jgi:hypothetical protein